MSQPTLLSSIEELLPEGVPPALRELHTSVQHCQKVYGEMLTQVSPEVSQTLASLRDLHKSETKLLVAIIKSRLP